MASDHESPRIKITRNGPYLVSGRVPLGRQSIVSDDEGTAMEWRNDGSTEAGASYALCRCGQSGKKPYCDASHLD